jgi:hypothetical protein
MSEFERDRVEREIFFPSKERDVCTRLLGIQGRKVLA